MQKLKRASKFNIHTRGDNHEPIAADKKREHEKLSKMIDEFVVGGGRIREVSVFDTIEIQATIPRKRGPTTI